MQTFPVAGSTPCRQRLNESLLGLFGCLGEEGQKLSLCKQRMCSRVVSVLVFALTGGQVRKAAAPHEGFPACQPEVGTKRLTSGPGLCDRCSALATL